MFDLSIDFKKFSFALTVFLILNNCEWPLLINEETHHQVFYDLLIANQIVKYSCLALTILLALSIPLRLRIRTVHERSSNK